MIRTTLFIGLIVSSLPASAALIGSDSFDYPDGSIGGRNGGTGWDRNGSSASDWDNTNSGGTVVSSTLATSSHNGGIRQYGDPEFDAAVQSSGQVFFQVTLGFGATLPDYAGMSSYDFASEKVFFGRVSGGNLGIDEEGDRAETPVVPQALTTYQIVGVIDYANSLIAMWVDPDATDYYDAANGGLNSADVTKAFNTAANWSSAVRLQAGDGGTASWDDLVVATEAVDVGLAVPEPTGSLLTLLGLAGLVVRRRRA